MPIVTLDEVREHLNLADDEGGTLLPSLIFAAASYIESAYGLVSDLRVETFVFEGLDTRVPLTLRPVDPATVAATIERIANATEPLDGLQLRTIGGWLFVSAPAAGLGTIFVDASVGYGDGADAGADRLLGAMKAATLIMVAHLFGDREGATPVPAVVDMLLGGFELKRV